MNKEEERKKLTEDQFCKLRKAAENFVLSVTWGFDYEIDEGKTFDLALIEKLVIPFIEPLINEEL